eukprot:scaffold360_cov374-Pavlova_lutheri.AAC.13
MERKKERKEGMERKKEGVGRKGSPNGAPFLLRIADAHFRTSIPRRHERHGSRQKDEEETKQTYRWRWTRGTEERRWWWRGRNPRGGIRGGGAPERTEVRGHGALRSHQESLAGSSPVREAHHRAGPGHAARHGWERRAGQGQDRDRENHGLPLALCGTTACPKTQVGSSLRPRAFSHERIGQANTRRSRGTAPVPSLQGAMCAWWDQRQWRSQEAAKPKKRRAGGHARKAARSFGQRIRPERQPTKPTHAGPGRSRSASGDGIPSGCGTDPQTAAQKQTDHALLCHGPSESARCGRTGLQGRLRVCRHSW